MDSFWLDVRHGLRLLTKKPAFAGIAVVTLALGIAVGLAISFGVTRFIHALLFGLTPTDPITLLAVLLILIGVAILACSVPARRATGVDPIVAPRYE